MNSGDRLVVASYLNAIAQKQRSEYINDQLEFVYMENVKIVIERESEEYLDNYVKIFISIIEKIMLCKFNRTDLSNSKKVSYKGINFRTYIEKLLEADTIEKLLEVQEFLDKDILRVNSISKKLITFNIVAWSIIAIIIIVSIIKG